MRIVLAKIHARSNVALRKNGVATVDLKQDQAVVEHSATHRGKRSSDVGKF